jgi:hypothetical protein
MYSPKPFVPEPSYFQVEIAVGRLKRFKSPGICQILAELFQAAGNTLRSEIHRLTNYIWNKDEVP